MDVNGALWRKSNRSAGNGGQCVELADLGGDIGIRDSKSPAAGHLTVSRRILTDLVTQIKNSELDL